MVEVEEGGLGALEQHVLADLEGLVHEVDRVRHVGLHPRREVVEVHRRDLVHRGRELVVDLGEHRCLVLEHQRELLAEDLRVVEVLHPQAHPRRLVGVGRADPALGRAERVLAEVSLGHPVDELVVGEDEVRVARHLQPRAVDASVLEHGDLVEEHLRVHHHPVADHRGDVGVEHSARDELQREGLAIDDERVPGVVAALVAHHQVHLLGEEVGEPTLALVAPLGPDDDRRRHEGRRYLTVETALSDVLTAPATLVRSARVTGDDEALLALVDEHGGPVDDLALEERGGEPVGHLALDHPLEGPGAEGGVVPFTRRARRGPRR